MKLYGVVVINLAVTADQNLVEKDSRHHSFFSQAWSSFTDAVSDLFTGFSEVSQDITSLDYTDWGFSDTTFNLDAAEADYNNIPDFGSDFKFDGFGSSSNPDTGINDLIPKNVKCETKLSGRKVRAGARIVGGTVVNRNTWKWYARLRIESGSSSYLCGGTIIGKRWILTAAHCTDGVTGRYIQAVINDHVASETDSNERTMEIKNVYNHPMYRSDDGAPRHDIALLETTSDLYSTGSQSAPACIPPSDARLSDMTGAPGKCYVAGFGTTEWQGEASEELRSINVNIYSDQVCQIAYSQYNSNMEFCAGHMKGGRDACQGDSGGPLICINDQNEPIVYGIVSWGGVCAKPESPGLYTRVHSYYNWIYGVTRYTRTMKYEIEQETESGNILTDTLTAIKDVFTGNSAGTQTCNVTVFLFMLFTIMCYQSLF